MNVLIVALVSPNVQMLLFMKALTIGAINGTSLEGQIVLPNGKQVDADEAQIPISDEYYFIVPDKCTECMGFHEEPQCAAVCPVDCCVPDENNIETEEIFLGKQRFMHPED